MKDEKKRRGKLGMYILPTHSCLNLSHPLSDTGIPTWPQVRQHNLADRRHEQAGLPSMCAVESYKVRLAARKLSSGP